MRRARVVLLVAAVCAAAIPASQTLADPVGQPWPLEFLHVGPVSGPAGLHQVVDESGRAVLLRGVDVNGLEDYWAHDSDPLAIPYPIDPSAYTDGQCPARNYAVESMTICDFDARQWRSFGYDVIRLGVSWSLLEPSPGKIDTTYIDRIAQVVGWARAAGVYVIIDLHQDAWSKYIYTPAGSPCPPPLSPVTGAHEADGAPGWAAAHVTPACQFQQREADPAVIEDFQKFWSDLPGPDGVGLQEHYADVVAAIAARFADNPAVAGYDLFNEPSPGTQPPDVMDATTLFPFYAKLISTVRSKVPGFKQLFFIEPDITRDLTDHSFIEAPWSAYSSYGNVVYEPHIYTRVFTPDADLGPAGIKPFLPMSEGYQSAVSDAHALGLPLWVGEFGNAVPDDPTVLSAHYQNQDANDIGSGLWVWKADADRPDAVDHSSFSVMHGPFGEGVAYPSRAEYTSRAYPVYLAGSLTAMSYNAPSATFELRAAVPAAPRMGRCDGGRQATVIFIPAPTSGPVSVTGSTVSVTTTSDGNRIATVFPDGGAYSVTIGGHAS